ncbi:MAG: hypothetical protein A2Y23_01060 [Clostridiales bacterium GWB2_37_7]|nr:MAG: hypothetical protein A2Y23_01060 [Clostridiales bacterium GWB2_37_7]
MQKNFEILYDLIYSKEDSNAAFNMLTKFFRANIDSMNIEELDLAKILLVALNIHLLRNKMLDERINDKLKELFDACGMENSDWEKVLQKYNDIVNVE